MSTPPPTPIQTRLVALAFYLGAAPLCTWSPRVRANPVLHHHQRQALALQLCFGLVLLLFILGVLLVSWLMVNDRWWYEEVKIESWILSITRKFFLAWAVFWGFAATAALRADQWEMPILARIAKRPRLLSATAIALIATYATLLLAAGVAAHASSITRSDPAPGRVYMVYDDLDQYPRWLFALGFYRMANAADAKWGRGSAVLLKLTPENINRALREGTLVFIGSHGMDDGLLIPGGAFYTAADLPPEGPGPNLRYLYMAGCDQPAAWQSALAPAQVVSFDRLTAVVEHINWLWFQGPRILRQL